MMDRCLDLRLVLAGALLLLTSCASRPPIEEPAPPPPLTEKVWREPDLEGLQRSLGLHRPSRDLGYTERAFRTCEVGHGFPSDRDCQTAFLTLIQFRLTCRNSFEKTDGTAFTAADLTPLRGRRLRWNLNGRSGEVRLDQEGYGRLLSVFSGSPKSARLRLTAGNDFLALRANQIKEVATPPEWCTAGI